MGPLSQIKIRIVDLVQCLVLVSNEWYGCPMHGTGVQFMVRVSNAWYGCSIQGTGVQCMVRLYNARYGHVQLGT